MIGHIVFILILYFSSSLIFAKNSYPKPDKGYKRVDLFLPKIDNNSDYKVEIKFGTELMMSECSTIKNIYVNLDYLKLKRGFDFQYYHLDVKGAIFENIDKYFKSSDNDCKFDRRVKRKLLSFAGLFIDYKEASTISFFIPENLTLEFRLWKVTDDYKSLN